MISLFVLPTFHLIATNAEKPRCSVEHCEIYEYARRYTRGGILAPIRESYLSSAGGVRLEIAAVTGGGDPAF